MTNDVLHAFGRTVAEPALCMSVLTRNVHSPEQFFDCNVPLPRCTFEGDYRFFQQNIRDYVMRAEIRPPAAIRQGTPVPIKLCMLGCSSPGRRRAVKSSRSRQFL